MVIWSGDRIVLASAAIRLSPALQHRPTKNQRHYRNRPHRHLGATLGFLLDIKSRTGAVAVTETLGTAMPSAFAVFRVMNSSIFRCIAGAPGASQLLPVWHCPLKLQMLAVVPLMFEYKS